MAKIIETKDGIRLLVSDDTPEDIDYYTSEEKVIPTALAQENSVDPLIITISFESNENRDLLIKAERFSFLDIKRNTVMLSGLMTLEDFLWLAEHQDKTIRGLSTISFQLLIGSYKIDRLIGKDINALTVNVNLSLKRHT